MKKFNQLLSSLIIKISLLLVMFSGGSILGQAPGRFNYQAVLRDPGGEPKQNYDANIQISILQGSAAGSVVYSETHSAATNYYGLVNLEIGSKNPAIFSAIDWSNGPYYVKISVDGTEMGTSQLLSVPYALYAESGAGEQGIQGIQGEKGDQGDPGPQGIQGDIGDTGPQGAQGAQGVKGDKGDKGDTGPQGPIGDTGPQGPIGPIGPKGDKGDKGDPGVNYSGIDWVNISVTRINVDNAVNVGSISLNVPTAGYVLVTFSGHAVPSDGDRLVLAASNVSAHWDVNDGNVSVFGDGRGGDSFSHSRVYAVAAGTYTFYAVAHNWVELAGNGTASIYGILTAQFYQNRY